jgi:hypothetical protein
MPPLVIEPPSSRSVNYNSGSPTATRTFIVTGCATETDVYALFKLDGEPPNNLPNKFSLYPNLSDLNPPVQIVAMDFSLARDPAVQEKWSVTVTYRETALGGSFTQLSPNDTGYVAVRGSTESAMGDLWRTYTSDADFGYWLAEKAPLGFPTFSVQSTQGDIGGLKIDVAGRPTRTMVMYESIVVDVTLGAVPDIRAIRDTIGSRNSTELLGLPVGAVLFRGARWTNISPGKWQVSYDFLADYFYHMIQQPLTDRLGNPFLDGQNHAEFVNWSQPYLRLKDHRSMSPYLLALP